MTRRTAWVVFSCTILAATILVWIPDLAGELLRRALIGMGAVTLIVGGWLLVGEYVQYRRRLRFERWTADAMWIARHPSQQGDVPVEDRPDWDA